MAPFEALYGRRCKSPVGWFEVGESSLFGPKIIYDALDKVQVIKDRLKITYSQKKSYANNWKREVEFEEGDKMYLKISPMKGEMRFGKKGNVSPRYMGPYKVLQRVKKVAYELRLTSELALVLPVFHVSMLIKCIGNPVSILPIKGLGVDENLSY